MISQDQVRYQPTLNLKFGKDYHQNSTGLSCKHLEKKTQEQVGVKKQPHVPRKAGKARRAKAAKARRAIAAKETQATDDV